MKASSKENLVIRGLAVRLAAFTFLVSHVAYYAIFGLFPVGYWIGIELWVLGVFVLYPRTKLPLFLISCAMSAALGWAIAKFDQRLGPVEFDPAITLGPGIFLIVLALHSLRPWVILIVGTALVLFSSTTMFPDKRGSPMPSASAGNDRKQRGLRCVEHSLDISFRIAEGAFRASEAFLTEEGEWDAEVETRETLKYQLGESWVERLAPGSAPNPGILYNRIPPISVSKPAMLQYLAEVSLSDSFYWCPLKITVNMPLDPVLKHNLAGDFHEQILDDGSLGSRLVSTDITGKSRTVMLRYPPAFFQNSALSALLSPLIWRPWMWLLSIPGTFIMYLFGVAASGVGDSRIKPLILKIFRLKRSEEKENPKS